MKYVEVDLELDDELEEYVTETAKKNGVTVDQIVSDILWAYFSDLNMEE